LPWLQQGALPTGGFSVVGRHKLIFHWRSDVGAPPDAIRLILACSRESLGSHLGLTIGYPKVIQNFIQSFLENVRESDVLHNLKLGLSSRHCKI
jgi:hypothetical protein